MYTQTDRGRAGEGQDDRDKERVDTHPRVVKERTSGTERTDG